MRKRGEKAALNAGPKRKLNEWRMGPFMIIREYTFLYMRNSKI